MGAKRVGTNASGGYAIIQYDSGAVDAFEIYGDGTMAARAMVRVGWFGNLKDPAIWADMERELDILIELKSSNNSVS